MKTRLRRSKGERAAREAARQAKEGVLVPMDRPYELRSAPERPITEDDYAGTAPCIMCSSFPGEEPWYACDETPTRVIHHNPRVANEWHSMSREKFGQFQRLKW